MGEPLHKVSKIANIQRMNWTVSYFNERVQREIAEWPVGIYADYLRLILLVEEHGADLRLPHSRAMGDGLFELRPRGALRHWPGVLLFSDRPARRSAARVHQQDAADARTRTETGAQALEGVD